MTPRAKSREPVGSVTRSPSDDVEIGRLVAAARRQVPLVALCAAFGLVLALLYVVTAQPLYTARETILLDEVRAELLDQVSAFPSAVLGDSAVGSEVEIIKSQAIALRVVDRLGLADDPEFKTPTSSPLDELREGVGWVLSAVRHLVAPSPAEEIEGEPADPRYAAAAVLGDGLEVERVGRTYVIEIAYQSPDPNRAVAIARAFGEAYRTFQLESNVEAMVTASEWLGVQVDAVRERSLEAKRAAQTFRRENRLLLVDGEPLADQELMELTRQLAVAQSETAQAKSRWDEYRRLLDSGTGGAISTSAVMTGTSSDEGLGKLRELFLDAERRRARVSERWGDEHPQAVRLGAEMKLYEGRMLEEMRRAAEGVGTAYRVALDREAHLRNTLATMAEQAASQEEHLTMLRQLEQSALAYDTVYQNLLTRFERTAMQQDFPIASVRILSHAETPKGQTSPRRGVALALGLVLGSLLGAGIGVIREAGRPITTSGQVIEELDLDFIGYGPTSGRTDRVATSAMRRMLSTLDVLTDSSEAASGSVLGIAAVVPERRRSDAARQLAASLAEHGETVLLVDAADGEAIGSAHLSRSLGSRRCSRPVTLDIREDPAGYHVAGLETRRDDAKQVKGMRPFSLGEWVAAVRPNYGYVLVRLPPLGTSPAARAAEAYVDAFALIIPWGRVTSDLVCTVLAENRWFRRKCLGVILSDTNFGKLRLYVGAQMTALWRA